MRQGQEASIYWQPEWEHERGAKGSDVPVVAGDELVQAMRENLAEAIRMKDTARVNLLRAKTNGLVLVDEKTEMLRPMTRGEGKKKYADPQGDVAISDWVRSVAEVAHWTEYLDWAKAKRGDAPRDAGSVVVTEEEKRAFVDKWKSAIDARVVEEREPGSDDD